MTRLATAVVPISVADVADSGLWVSFGICRSLFAKCPDNLSQPTLLALLRHALQQMLYQLEWLRSILGFAGLFLPSVLTIRVSNITCFTATRLATAVVPISMADVADTGLWVYFGICRSLFAKCPDNLSLLT